MSLCENQWWLLAAKVHFLGAIFSSQQWRLYSWHLPALWLHKDSWTTKVTSFLKRNSEEFRNALSVHICLYDTLWNEVWYGGIVVNLDIPCFKINIFWDGCCSSAIGTEFILLCRGLHLQDKIPVKLNAAALDISKVESHPWFLLLVQNKVQVLWVYDFFWMSFT